MAYDVTRLERDGAGLIRKVLDNLFVFVGVLEPDGTVLDANAAPLAAAGIALEDVIGKKFWDCYWWNYSDTVQAQLREACIAASRGENIRYDVMVRMEGDSRMWIDFQISGLCDSQGCVTHLVPSAVQITNRKAAEERLRQRAEELEQLMEVVPAAVWVSRDPECLKITGNRRAGELFEATPEENFSATTVPEARRYFDPEGRELAASELPMQQAVAANREINGVELTVELPSKRRIVMLGSAAPLRTEEGQVRGGVAAFIDITDRKKVEHDLWELNETLEQRIGQRTAEAQDAAHRLRALAVKLSDAGHRERRRLAAVLHDGLQQWLVSAKYFLGTLHSQLKHPGQEKIVRQVEEMLDQSLEASRSLTVELFPPVLESGTMISILEWLGNRFAERHGLRVNVRSEKEYHIQDVTSRTIIFQAVRELLFNVVKHSKVHHAVVAVGQRGSNGFEVTVSDSGVGFDSTQPRAGDGGESGFGLLNVRELLHSLGGTLRMESAPGQGTRASVFLPVGLTTTQAVDAVVAIPTALTRPAADLAKVRVLLADDHAVVRDGIVQILNLVPWIEVIGQAQDGLQAVAMAERFRPDIAILDLSMPRMSGIEATRQILAASPATRVIALSMLDEQDVAAEVAAAGAMAYVSKSAGAEALIAAIRESAGGRADAQPSDPARKPE
jgi:PAS domain S-box-containing protein